MPTAPWSVRPRRSNAERRRRRRDDDRAPHAGPRVCARAARRSRGGKLDFEESVESARSRGDDYEVALVAHRHLARLSDPRRRSGVIRTGREGGEILMRLGVIAVPAVLLRPAPAANKDRAAPRGHRLECPYSGNVAYLHLRHSVASPSSSHTSVTCISCVPSPSCPASSVLCEMRHQLSCQAASRSPAPSRQHQNRRARERRAHLGWRHRVLGRLRVPSVHVDLQRDVLSLRLRDVELTAVERPP